VSNNIPCWFLRELKISLQEKGRMVCGAVALAAAKRRANDTVRNAVMKL